MPRVLDLEAETTAAQSQMYELEQVQAASQVKQPDLFEVAAEWNDGADRGAEDGTRGRTFMNLVPERQSNLSVLRGEQDGANKLSYSAWARAAKDHFKGRGTHGRWLVGILDWPVRVGDVQITNEVLVKLGVPKDTMKQLEHAVYMFMKNYTAGHAKEVIQHGVQNGIDAWRKLYRNQLPLAEDKRNLIMTEFMRLKEPAQTP